ncbi:MAG: maleylpyruvate isomerase N-terminal domain-containing protein [Acidimicrobiia bacterium]
MTIRATYLEAATTAVNLLANPAVGGRWDEPSACDGMSVGALAAHLSRSLTQVEAGLAEPVPTGRLVDAVEYYMSIADQLLEPGSDVNRSVVARAEAQAAPGCSAVVARARDVLARLREELDAAAPDRTVVALGQPMLLDEYLRTRVVELVVHLDDLGVSLGIEPVVVAPAAHGEALALLLAIARERSGDLMVLRALTRRDRTTGDPLRVF